VREYAARTGLPVLVREGYDLDEFLVRVAGRGSGRCEQCYRMRLSAAAAEARTRGFGLYSTSLLYSKYQKHDLIRGVAREMAQEQGIDFHYADFREGWKDGIAASRPWVSTASSTAAASTANRSGMRAGPGLVPDGCEGISMRLCSILVVAFRAGARRRRRGLFRKGTGPRRGALSVGAKEMAQRGYDCGTIVAHYYP